MPWLESQPQHLLQAFFRRRIKSCQRRQSTQIAYLNRKYGLNVGVSKVRRLMNSMNLPKNFSKKSPNYSSKFESVDYKNILNRKFHK